MNPNPIPKPKQQPIRALGQRSIASTFLFSSRNNPASDSKTEEVTKDSKNKSRVSLSDFLNKKLPRTSETPKSVQGKSIPFTTLLSLRSSGDITDKGARVEEVKGKETDGGHGEVMLQQFKHSETGGGRVESANPAENSSADGEQGVSLSSEEEAFCLKSQEQVLKKRRNPFEGADEKHVARKDVIVLADESRGPKPRKRGKRGFVSNTKPKNVYDHYANGRGWWNDDMEGVDNEELGFTEVWEGVGSTTLGGIADWH